MVKIVDCGKVNPASGCGHVIRADSEEEVLRLAGEHAVKEHGLQPTPELIAAVKQNIETA
jgi:predicted small metal-binding protein